MTNYTCPMHPEIMQSKAGDCPHCGMALEQIGANAEEPNAELIDFTRRLWLSVAAAIPLLLITMGAMLGLPIRDLLGEQAARYLELALATPVVLWAAQPFFIRGVRSVINLSLNMWTLIMLGVGAAYGYSVVATLAPDLFPQQYRMAGQVPVYFESAVVIIALVFLGQVLEIRAREHTGAAIRALMDLVPKMARRLNADGSEEDIQLDKVQVGDRLRVRPGAAVPVDGVVLEGHSFVDESLISGEPMAVEKQPDDQVIGGTLNENGQLIIQAQQVGADTMLAKIVALVAEASRSRAPIQSLADQVAGWFVPVIVIIAVLSFIIWLILGPDPALALALISSISVLIIACPCALGLATPMSITTGVGRGAHAGVLVKDAASLEMLSRVDTLIVDKTGTLTEGRPELTDLVACAPFEDATLLALAAGLEQASEHPLATAIVAGAKARVIAIGQASEFENLAGAGAQGVVEGRKIAVGNSALMDQLNIDISHLDERVSNWRTEGKTVIFVAIDGQLAGLMAVTDPIKFKASEAVQWLRDNGVSIILATGDHTQSAKAVADKLGIDAVHAQLSPQDKQVLVKQLQADGLKVAMAGDGVNDAPALSTADVGIAMGTGADVAIQSAGITLPKGDLTALVRACALARATLRNIRQNLLFAFAYNSLGVPIAAGILYPLTGSLLSPMIAAAAMSLSSVSVIANALRLRTIKL